MEKKGKKITIILTILFIFIVALTVNANNISTRIEIEKPTSVETVKQILNYQGWVMSEDRNGVVEIYLDGVKQNDPERVEREDVLKAITEYGGRNTNTKPGYRGSINISSMDDGIHTLGIKVISSTGAVIKEEKRTINVKKYDTRTYIDAPYSNQTVNTKLDYQGWVMSEDKDAKVNIYLDGVKQNDPERIGREDVLNAVLGYGGRNTNPKPGYRGTIDVSSLSIGTSHRFTVEIVSGRGEILEKQEKMFQVKEYEGRIQIESPSNNQRIKSKLDYQGWVMSEDSNATVEIYLDGVKQNNPERVGREDVLKAITKYGGRRTNTKPGYKGSVDLTTLNDGFHTITTRLVSRSGSIIKEEKRTINVKKYDTRTYIDAPYSNQTVNTKLDYQGWVMSEDKDAKVNIYLDGVKQNDPERIGREDVLKAVLGYGGRNANPKPGYRGTIDVSSLSIGTSHRFTVEIVSGRGEILEKQEKMFQVKEYEGRIQIESPNNNQRIKSKLEYQGWIMSEDSNATVEIYLDGVKQNNPERVGREDVLKAITGYGGRNTNSHPGYKGSIDLTALKDGSHTLTIRLVASTGKIIKEETRKLNVKKYDTRLELESPTKSNLNREDLSIKGWIMSEDKDAKVNVSIDGNRIDDNRIERVGREDVLRAIAGYGGRSTNVKPGYRVTISKNELTEGSHTIRIEVISSKTNEVMSVQTKKIELKKYETRIELEKPSNSQKVKTSIEVQGWVMSEDRNGVVEIYLDGVKQNNPERVGREDVLKAITGYGGRETNTKPGYKATIDSSGMKDGTHTIEVRYISSESSEISKKVTTKFTIKKYDGMLYLESPISSNFNDSVRIIGWEMSELDGSYVKAYIDTTDMNVSFKRTERDDVINAITGYGGKNVNSTPGFDGTINLSRVTEGKHGIRICLYSKLNELITQTTKYIYVYKNKFYGIDVSSYNVINSWQTVKNNGFNYAMIRAGVRGYGINNLGINGYLREDDKFLENVRGATDVGVKVGSYVFSQAVSEIEAVQEAQLAIRMADRAGGHSKIKLPIAFDSEYSGCWSNGSRCGRADYLSREDRTTIAIAFLETIKNAGYTPMIYASTSFLNNQLNMARLSNYDVWVAHYDVSAPTYKGMYQMWQYTSKGFVPGITGNVDVNEVYKQY